MTLPIKDKYINPLTDYGFKRLFGSEPNKNLLIDFLNQILPEPHKIKDLSYSKNEQVGQTAIDRKAIYDLYCIAPTGERFIVELQKAKQNYFKDRSVYYASFPVQEQGKKGDWNYKLDPVYTVGILDFVFNDHKNDKRLLHTVELKDQDGKVFYEKLKFIYIELPKFNKTVDELKSHYEKWLFVFKHLSQLQKRPEKLQEKVFKQLFEAAEIAKFTPVERKAYEQSVKYYRDLKNVIDTSHEEGRKIESNTNIKNGIKKGYSDEVIADFTGRSIKDIQELRQKMNNLS